MEMNSKKEGNSETSDRFVNFSIREYVAEIRKKDWKKCWPFGSLGDINTHIDLVLDSQAPESRFLSSQNCPRDSDASDDTREPAEAPNSSEVEIPKGIEAGSETTPANMIAAREIDDNTSNGSLELKGAQCPNEQSINEEGAKIGSDVGTDDDEPQKNLTRRKPQRFLLLSDILRDLAGPSGDFHVHCDITNADNVNGKFTTETEDESDDVTLDTLFKKQKGIQVTPGSSSSLKNEKKKKKKRKTVQVEEPRVDHDKRSKPGSEDSHGNDLDLGSKSSSIKSSIGELDMRTKKKCKKSSAEVRPSTSQTPSYLGSEENTFKMQEFLFFQDPSSPCWHKSNKEVEARAEVTITEASETANEDSEMEAVKLLARHFVEEENPSSPAHGVKRAQMVQSITRNLEVEPLKASYKSIVATTTVSNYGKGTSPSSILQKKSHSSGNRSSESGYGQRFANVNNLSKSTETACACVQKKIRESSIPAGDKSVPTTQFLRLFNTGIRTQSSSKTHKKFTKEKQAVALSWVQRDDHCLVLNGLVPPPSGSMVCQPHMEVNMMKASAGVARATLRGCWTSVCSTNRNPADFSTPNAENKFMR